MTIIAPFSAGGTADIFGRMLANGLQQKYGTTFIVENRPGAGGNIGATAVSRAPKVKALEEIGAVPSPITPEAFTAFIEAERKKWQEVVVTAGISLNSIADLPRNCCRRAALARNIGACGA